MPQRSVVAVGASLLVASLALAGCGTRGGSSSDGGSGGGSGDTKTAKIGVIAPLSGDLAALGKGIEHSVDLAIKQANESNAIPGWKLELAAEDDQATPDVGKNAATKLASDKDVVGVVGTLNSSVAQSVQPVLASANITMVSPANTNPSLTQGADFATAPKRSYPNYFRTCTTDSIQGPFAARYLFDKAGIKEVATVHDKKTYGQGLVEAFTKEYTKLGGKIVAAETINPDDDKYDAVISKIKPSNPKAVYYGGEYPQGAPFSQQMKAAGLNVPLMGGDGVYSGEFIKLAGATANGDLATAIGAPTDTLPSAKDFVASYGKAGYAEPYEAYGAYAFDAANAIINALKVSLKDATSADAAREATVKAMSDVSFDGVTGKVAFDEYGDTTSRVLTVYQVTGDAWKPVNTEEFK
ncbi:branched-chain amino acid ABC transporter substrate-binding protein [Phycicoccus duodecadis]|uniref:Amino acid/amide ABC transporter substrate-binding protein (HAAT family) n=1 Tax=Phycicoccus duodecadis TaxID=173053 RepID=A0A2N3YEG7_9MICO|nr:branched-chain amino acid ABC transporter substrate-binding protein [Phycicoccus duodecadis]PKW25237.1 amino acid/amide ABC transporter substrate-binding protein (HAAT family) [Phycicoccus duodecadis]